MKSVTNFRERQKALGRDRKDYYLTPAEHAHLKEKLKQFRGEENERNS